MLKSASVLSNVQNEKVSLPRAQWNLDAYCKMDPFGAERQANKSKCGSFTLNDDDRDDDLNNTASFVHSND
jgi:hypothetical protein